MKKSLLVLALFGAAGIAQAASVTVYGRFDAGFKYNYAKSGNEVVKSFKMEDGLVGGSRIGVKGVEQIGDLKVGFQLENGFNIATGEMNTAGKLFDRQARAFVEGDFGSVHVGRFGGVGADSSMDVVFGQYALGGGDNDFGFAGVTTSKQNAAIEYKSPVFSGVQVHAMYANSQAVDAKKKGYLDQKNAHYYGLAVDYNDDNLGLVAAYEETKKADKKDKGSVFNLAGSYDFEVVKAHLGYQYAKSNAESATVADDVNFASRLAAASQPDAEGDLIAVAAKSHTYTIGLSAPVAGGEVLAQFSHGQVKPLAGGKQTIDTLAARYAYDLSKRTQLYIGAGIAHGKDKTNATAGTIKVNARQVYFGLGHNF